jgi:hypothetical protein
MSDLSDLRERAAKIDDSLRLIGAHYFNAGGNTPSVMVKEIRAFIGELLALPLPAEPTGDRAALAWRLTLISKGLEASGHPVDAKACIDAASALREAQDGGNGPREAVAQWMIAHSIATGHGDTLDDLLRELRAQDGGRAERQRIAVWLRAKGTVSLYSVGYLADAIERGEASK